MRYFFLINYLFNPYYKIAANGRTVLTLDTQDIRACNTKNYPLMMKKEVKVVDRVTLENSPKSVTSHFRQK